MLDRAALDRPGATFADLDAAAAFAAVIDRAAEIDILLVGCGPRTEMVPAWLRQACQPVSIAVDAMDTGAACRTFNLLRGEERRVAAALLPV